MEGMGIAVPMPSNERKDVGTIRKMGKAATMNAHKSGADGVTCSQQEFEQTVRNLLSTPHKPHTAGEKAKEAASKGDLQSSGKGSK
jgi:hypothetical protein